MNKEKENKSEKRPGKVQLFKKDGGEPGIIWFSFIPSP